MVHAVQVTVLDEPPLKMNGNVVNISGGGFQLQTTARIRLNAAVRIDLADAVLLGEVCYCRDQGDGNYAIGLESQQILTHAGDLAQLMKGLSGGVDREAEVTQEPRHAILANEW